MARYSIFDGGNLRLYPWENDRNSGIDPSYPVRYSAHLPNKQKVLPYHVDPNNEVFRRWMQDTLPTGSLVPNDELVIHLYGPGTYIHFATLQVKSVPPTTGTGGNPPPTPATFALSIEAEDGTVLQDLGSYLMDTVGYIPLIDPGEYVFVPNNGFFVARLVSGDANYSCFEVFVSLDQHYSGRPCDCSVAPCGAEFPDPNCAPAGLSLDSTAGTGLVDGGGGGG